MEPPELVQTAIRATLAGGEVVRGRAGQAGDIEAKGLPGDWVTDADRASERVIAATLTRAHPTIPVRGEELGGDTGPRFWLVDPLDGTTNFVHGFPVVGISVALIEDGHPTIGVVHAPFLHETYWGAQGLGGRVTRGDGSESRLHASARPPERAIVGTGFPFRSKGRLPRYLRALGGALERFEDLRRPGAASLDLAWVAAGVFDGFFELGLAPWDVAAGALLIEEAGGLVTDWEGGAEYLAGDILAGSPAVHGALRELVDMS